MVLARDCAILRHARFHVRCLCIRETGVIAYGQGALGQQRGLDAVDDEQRVMLLGQQSGRIVELALQRLSGLTLSLHHVQGLDVQVVIFSSFDTVAKAAFSESMLFGTTAMGRWQSACWKLAKCFLYVSLQLWLNRAARYLKHG